MPRVQIDPSKLQLNASSGRVQIDPAKLHPHALKADNRGRPNLFSAELWTYICDGIAAGKSTRAVCREENMPAETSVRLWLIDLAGKSDSASKGLVAQWHNAIAARAEKWAEEIVDIADDATNDFMERERKNGEVDVVLDREHVERSKLRIQARQWHASRILPKYSDKQQVQLTGKDGGPVQTAALVMETNDPIEASKIYARLMNGES